MPTEKLFNSSEKSIPSDTLPLDTANIIAPYLFNAALEYYINISYISFDWVGSQNSDFFYYNFVSIYL